MRMSSSSPDDEPGDSGHSGDLGVEHPASASERLDVAFGQRILLAQEVVGQQTQFQPDAVTLGAVHPEDVDKSLLVFGTVLPGDPGWLHGADSGGLEEFVRTAFEVVAPDLHVVGREGEGSTLRSRTSPPCPDW